MELDQQKLSQHRLQPPRPGGANELRRIDQLLLVGPELPLHPTLETIFESDCQKPIDLFWLSFADSETYLRGEDLVRQLKKNFRGYLLGRFETLPERALIDRAYAAGLDLLELPLTTIDDRQLALLDYARSVFPPWGVIATLPALGPTGPWIDALAQRGIIPLLHLSGVAAELPDSQVSRGFQQLLRGWQRYKIKVKPLRPLLEHTTPLRFPPKPRGVGALLGRVDEARLRTSSDLRRLLRVREVAASFESAGL